MKHETGRGLRARVASERCKEVGEEISEVLGVSKEMGSMLAAAALGIAAKRGPVRIHLDDDHSVDVDSADATSAFAIQGFALLRSYTSQLAPRRPRPKKLASKRKGKR